MSGKWHPPLLTHWWSLSRKLSIVLRVISGGMAATSRVIASLNACSVVGWSLYIWVFSVPKEKDHKVINQVTFGGQAMSPCKERRHPGNNSLSKFLEPTVALSFLEPNFSLFMVPDNWLNLGRRKVSIMWQQWIEFTVTVRPFSSKKIWTPHTRFSNGAPNCHKRAVKWSLVKFLGVFCCPVGEILFIYSTWQVEVDLIKRNENSARGDVLKNFLTHSSASFKMSLT